MDKHLRYVHRWYDYIYTYVSYEALVATDYSMMTGGRRVLAGERGLEKAEEQSKRAQRRFWAVETISALTVAMMSSV